MSFANLGGCINNKDYKETSKSWLCIDLYTLNVELSKRFENGRLYGVPCSVV